ncbi:hypothetical protein LDENG_00185790 [Lucifuga dentata]|nr:hypothetical protein LDENG_00185790 [Lucifuga dentata]
MSAEASLQRLALTPERIPDFLIPSRSALLPGNVVFTALISRGFVARSCFSTMNAVHKRLKLSPSKPASLSAGAIVAAARASRTQHRRPPDASHDALLLPSPEGGEEGEGYLLVEEDTTDSSLVITMEDSQLDVKAARRKRKKKLMEEKEDKKTGASESEDEEAGAELEIDRQLDQSLETKSKQHNLTTVNVKNIIHEVITNEHVVAMMKAAINETEAVPPFEPKMTRSRLKEVVEKGVVIPTWNISPIKKPADVNKAPQFVDIPLAEEDSSDEEYHPDEEEEDETAEETLQESDMETPPPKSVTDSTFLEKLHAVEEELAVCLEPYQPLSEDEVGLMAYRTRSKRPLRDVPLGRLEAELRAPDITPDMYDSGSAHEDREWTDWLRGLMTSDVENEEECDDEDDPEYNFLADIDEPDLEDYRDDKAVRITKKEVNELMEELFETLKEEFVGQEVDDEGHEDDDEPQEESHMMHIHTLQEDQSTRVGEAEEEPITELRTVKQQLSLMRKRQQLGLPPCTRRAEPYTLRLDDRQRARLQQQIQQYVQLLTQVHLLSIPVTKLHGEAKTTRQFLFELDLLAQRGEVLAARPGFRSTFRASNLQGALQLLEELQQLPISYEPRSPTPDALGRMRCYPVMPAELAWLFATRPVFLYPELLPCASLDPARYCPRRTAAFTAAEDCLLVLGLRNMEGSCDPPMLVSQFLLRKTLVQIRRRILQCCRPGFPDNVIKAYRYHRVLWKMPLACRSVNPSEQRPPVEREESLMPLWLVRSLPVIYPVIKQFNSPSGSAHKPLTSVKLTRSRQSHLTFLRSAARKCSFPAGTRYPPRLPACLQLRRIGFLLMQHPLSPPPDSSSSSLLSPGQPDSCIQLTPVTSPLSHSPPPAQTPPTLCSPQLSQNRPRVLLQHLLLMADGKGADDSNVTVTTRTSTRERIVHHYRTFTSLRRSRLPWLQPIAMEKQEKDGQEAHVQENNTTENESNERRRRRSDEEDHRGSVSHGDPTSSQSAAQEAEMTFMMDNEEEGEMEDEQKHEEEEEDGNVNLFLLTLSESSPSTAGSVNLDDNSLDDLGDAGSEGREQEVVLTPSKEEDDNTDDDDEVTSSDEAKLSIPELQVGKPSSEGRENQDNDEDDDDDDVAFAKNYLHRVCDAMQASVGGAEPMLQVLDQFSAAAASGGLAALFSGLSGVLQPWPHLLKDFAAFLSPAQATCCGLLEEQQLFERCRHFLLQLRRSLGEGSSLYQEVVSILQESSAPGDMETVSSILRGHSGLQQEFWEFFQHFRCETPDPDFTSGRKTSDSRTGSDEEENQDVADQPVCAKNISVTSTGEKVILWTREVDRVILTTCQQRGANHKTFKLLSAQLGNKTAQQVKGRFQDLMVLFRSATQKSISSSSKGRPISSQDASPV